jgi:hypothetical protein
LTSIKKYFIDNINKRVTLILDDWELATSSTSISTRILNLKEYLQKDLEAFYDKVHFRGQYEGDVQIFMFIDQNFNNKNKKSII